MKPILSHALLAFLSSCKSVSSFVISSAHTSSFIKNGDAYFLTTMASIGSRADRTSKLSSIAPPIADTAESTVASGKSKRVYLFDEGDKTMVSLLGGKGANLAQMSTLGLPVPPGFIITTQVMNILLCSCLLC